MIPDDILMFATHLSAVTHNMYFVWFDYQTVLFDPNQRLKTLNFELLMRIELTTSSLPRKCSTPELQQPTLHNC